MATFSDSGILNQTGRVVQPGAATPDFGAAKKSKPNVKSIKFGDGFEQRLSVGVQQDLKIWSLTWSTLNDSDAEAIEKFFESLLGSKSFEWDTTLNDTGFSSPAPKKYICREWQRTFRSSNINEITATFEEVYET